MSTIGIDDGGSAGFSAHKARICAVLCGFGFRLALPEEVRGACMNDIELMKVLVEVKAEVVFASGFKVNEYENFICTPVGPKGAAVMYIA